MRSTRFQRVSIGGAFAVALSSFGLGQKAFANLVVDPSFELGTPAGPENTGGWNVVNGGVVSTTVARTGTHSLELDNGGTGNAAGVPLGFQTTNIGVTGGAEFVLTGFGMLTGPMVPAGSSNNGTSFFGIQATFFSGDNGAGTNLGTVSTGPGNAIFSNHLNSSSPVGVWDPLTTGVFTAPAGSESLQVFAIAIFPQMVTPGTTGVFVDDVDLEPVTVPEPASLGLLGIGSLAFLRRKR